MKFTFIFVLYFGFIGVFAQNAITEKHNIANSEKQAASRLMNLTVNPNTLNYDVTYHKLEFTVDPAIYFITGQVTTTYTALTNNMSSVTFDMANEMTVTSVTKNGMPLTFSESGNNELIITLLPILTFLPITTYGLMVTFFPILVSSEKKIVSGPIILTPDLINLFLNLI